MKLNSNTIKVLKNFGSIQENVVIDKGNTIYTVSAYRDIFAKVVLDQTIPFDMKIFDINNFLSHIGLLNEPDIVSNDSGDGVIATESGSNRKILYPFAAENLLTVPPKNINIPDEVAVTFRLEDDELKKIKSAVSVTGHENLAITKSKLDGHVRLELETTSKGFSYSTDIVGEVNIDDPYFVINTTCLKFISGSYDVKITTKKVSEFKHTEMDLTYWVLALAVQQ